MAEKFIKAQCTKSGKYFGLKIEPVDGTMRCTDFFNVSPEDGKKLASNVNVPGLETAATLRPCFRCGRRLVAGCSCAKRGTPCDSLHDYRFPCIYCKDLHVFSEEEGSELDDASIIGKTIRLEQGQEVVISAAGSRALEHILIGVGWDKALTGANMDLDSSVVMRGKGIPDSLVYFFNLRGDADSVIHHGDNLVGGKRNGDDEDSENIDVFLRKVPHYYDQLYFVLNIFNARERGQTLGSVRNMYIRLYDVKAKRVMVEYRVERGMERMEGMIIGKAYRVGDVWKFKAIGKGIMIDSVLQIGEECKE